MYKMHMDVRCDTLLDPSKNAANLLKHGVSLAEADGVLNDPTGHYSGGRGCGGRSQMGDHRYEFVRQPQGGCVDSARSRGSNHFSPQASSKRASSV
jgi:hypothetical protein